MSDIEVPSPKPPQLPKCTRSQCIDDGDSNKLECSLCKRLSHYTCTGLPAYQVHHFLSTKNYRKFVCVSCTVVADHLKQIDPVQLPYDSNEVVHELEIKINEKQVELDSLSATNRLLQNKIKELTQDCNKTDKNLSDEKKKSSAMKAEAEIMKTGIKNYEEKIAALQNELEAKKKESVSPPVNAMSMKPDEILQSLTEMMAKKFDEVEKNLKESIFTEVNKNNLQIEEKLEKVAETNKTYANALNNENKSAATITPATTQDFRSIIRDEHNEQRAEDSDKKARACNIVIHGFKELTTGEVLASENHDVSLINALLADIGLEDLNPKSVIRLGKKNSTVEQSKRPIKVTMMNEESKDRIMSNLKHLKGNDTYKGISITDDHTLKDRNTIKEWVDKAKAANASEPTDSEYVWKARGCPKNGMRLRKFLKRK